MNPIEFIPLIEPATKKDKESEIIPSGSRFSNPKEWESYQKREIEKNYLNFPEPILNGTYQYRLFDISLEDIERVINLHIGDTDIDESISLFGGYAISINGTIELFPQCCGLLEEIQLWKNILNDDFKEFYLTEGHPSPLITKKGNEIVIYCKDDFETFDPITTKEEIRLDYNDTKKALKKLIIELTEFSDRLNTLSDKFKTDNLSKIMIWGNIDNAKK
jgi:hypothetical protein